MTEEIRPPPVRADGLQLEEHRGFQERYWRVQRISWLGYGLAMVLALLGFSGSGGLFHMQEIRMGGAVAQLPRIARWEAWDEWTVTFSSAQDSHEIGVASRYLDFFELGQIRPEPEESSLATDGQVMRFSARDAPPHVVRISTRPMHFGWISFELTLEGESRTVHILVLP
ncbi:hypothetical protein [Paracoccus ravus]|uniref:hypothetical protein n=1 Tax=Paracoccus ravus TaxID=2447760 RepID=UPI00106E02C2|nr:hypothetical protein [Paracoccus ravus]